MCFLCHCNIFFFKKNPRMFIFLIQSYGILWTFLSAKNFHLPQRDLGGKGGGQFSQILPYGFLHSIHRHARAPPPTTPEIPFQRAQRGKGRKAKFHGWNASCGTPDPSQCWHDTVCIMSIATGIFGIKTKAEGRG